MENWSRLCVDSEPVEILRGKAKKATTEERRQNDDEGDRGREESKSGTETESGVKVKVMYVG